jgi:drug/metabolite transporter (DMT)-like permease
MEWMLFTLLAVFFWSVCNILDKFVVTRYIRNPIIMMMFLSSFSLIFAFIVAIFQPITIPSISLLLPLLASGICYFIGCSLYLKSLTVEEVSRVVSLYSITPIFVLILSTVFLHEIFTWDKYVGILLIVLGSVLISLKKEAKFKLSKALSLMTMSAIFIAFYYILQKFALNSLSYWNVFFWVRIGCFLSAPFLFFFYHKLFVESLKKYPVTGVYLPIIEILNVVGVYLIVIAYSVGYAGLVSAFTEIHSLVVFLMVVALSVFKPKILKEEMKGSTLLMKLISIIMIIAGAILII